MRILPFRTPEAREPRAYRPAPFRPRVSFSTPTPCSSCYFQQRTATPEESVPYHTPEVVICSSLLRASELALVEGRDAPPPHTADGKPFAFLVVRTEACGDICSRWMRKPEPR